MNAEQVAKAVEATNQQREQACINNIQYAVTNIASCQQQLEAYRKSLDAQFETYKKTQEANIAAQRKLIAESTWTPVTIEEIMGTTAS